MGWDFIGWLAFVNVGAFVTLILVYGLIVFIRRKCKIDTLKETMRSRECVQTRIMFDAPLVSIISDQCAFGTHSMPNRKLELPRSVTNPWRAEAFYKENPPTYEECLRNGFFVPPVTKMAVVVESDETQVNEMVANNSDQEIVRKTGDKGVV